MDDGQLDGDNATEYAAKRIDPMYSALLETEGETPSLFSKNLDRLIRKWNGNGQATRPWCGWLQKRSNLVAWHPHWFHLCPCDDDMQSAVLTYYSDVKGERRLYIENVRREPWLDSGDSIAFSVGLVQPSSARWSSRSKRVQLRAGSPVEAACFLLCLLRILYPDRTLPTMLMAAKTPTRLLRTLF